MSDKKEKWDYYTHIWKTEAAYLSWIRGRIRSIWATSPQRSEFIKSQSLKLPKYDEKGEPSRYKNGKIKSYKAFRCNECKTICYDCDKISGRKTYAVDHKVGNHSLRTFDQAPVFFDAMLRVKAEDLQILCNECHSIKTYAERYDMSLEDAKIYKIAIKICNQKEDKEFFTQRNLLIPSSEPRRKKAIIEYLKKESKKNND